MMVAEQIHRYPRWIVWLFELLSFLAVGIALARFGRDLLMLLWTTLGLDTALFVRVPYLPEIVQTISNGASLPRAEVGSGKTLLLLTSLTQLLPALGWLALALLLALLLRNSLPTVRTSPRGMLVEFASGWLAIPWETLRAIKVTEDLAAERFVLLAETDHRQLTGWHRFYSLIYRLGFRRGFLIISAISDFQTLIKTLLSETDRVARVLDNVKPARLQEEASSPLFRLLLSPGSFFSRRTKDEVQAAPAPVLAGPGRETLRGFYPRRISIVFAWGAALLAALLLVQYVAFWLKFLALTFPALRSQPIFDRLDLRQLPADWWLLIAAHILLIGMIWLLAGLRNLLPDLEARGEGLAVQHFGRWIVVPWSAISAIKVTELSDETRIVLIQAARGLPSAKRLSSMIYDGSLRPGVLVTSALSNFEQVLQRAVLEVTRQTETAAPSGRAILQSEARSNLLLLSFRSSTALDKIVAEARADETTKTVTARRLLPSVGTMAWLALPPALLLFADRAIQQGILPSAGLIGATIVLFVLALLEWPLVGLALTTLDDMTGGGEEGNRAFYVYPTIQLPRLLPQIGAVILALLGVPILPVLLWLGAIVWSFLLAAALCEELYDWRGGQLFAGGLIPVVFQLLILLAYLVVSR
jgi:hypothetical protein